MILIVNKHTIRNRDMLSWKINFCQDHNNL